MHCCMRLTSTEAHVDFECTVLRGEEDSSSILFLLCHIHRCCVAKELRWLLLTMYMVMKLEG